MESADERGVSARRVGVSATLKDVEGIGVPEFTYFPSAGSEEPTWTSSDRTDTVMEAFVLENRITSESPRQQTRVILLPASKASRAITVLTR